MSKSLTSLVILALLLGGLLFWRTNNLTNESVKEEGSNLAQEDSRKYWKEYKASNSNFQVHFPTLPQHANEVLKDPKTKENKEYDMYVSEADNGNLYMVNVVTYIDGKAPNDQEYALKSIVNDMVSANPQSRIKKMDLGEFQNGRAIDFSIEKDQTIIDGKAFIIGKKLYVLSSVADNAKHKQEDFLFFVNSFVLLSENKEQTGKKT